MVRWILNETHDLTRPCAYDPDTSRAPLMVYGDTEAHGWRVALLNGGVAATLTGISVRAMFVRSDGATVEANGTITGNVAEVIIPAEAYAVVGRMSGMMRLYTGADTQEKYVTISQRMLRVRDGETDTIVPTGTVMQSMAALCTQVAGMEARIDACEAKADALRVGDVAGLFIQPTDPTLDEGAVVPDGSVWIKTS